MKVLHVTDVDLPGRRFNGYDLIDDLASRGVEVRQAVLRKLSNNSQVIELAGGQGDHDLQLRIAEVERRHSINNLLIPWGRVLARSEEFASADVVHYHLIHNRVVSLYDLKWLFGIKPSVWTFHDPWPLTGHCIHPMECEGWLRRCTECPFLDRLFPIAHDHADRMWRLKHRLFAELDADIVVASAWMHNMIRRSELTAHIERVHLIPFGINPLAFLPDDEQHASRRRLGVAPDDFVVLVRAHSWEVKGLEYVIDALAERAPTRSTTVLSLDEPGRFARLRGAYRVVDLGWVHDPSLYAAVFSACDVFVMPSLAEAFGLMAVEAMAAGKPVVCFEGTALPAVTHAPECGIAVPPRDARALRAALDHLADNKEEARRRGSTGRAIVADEYEQGRYLNSLRDLYTSALERRVGVGAA